MSRTTALLGRTTVERVDRYVVWSVYVIDVVFAGMAVLVALSMAAGRGAETRVPAAVLVVATLVSTALHLRLTRPALEEYCGAPRLARTRLTVGAVSALVIVVAALLLEVSAGEVLGREAGSLSVLWLIVLALVPAVCVWGVLPRTTWGALALSAGIGGFVVAVWSGAAAASTSDAVGAAGFFALTLVPVVLSLGGIAVSVRLSAWLLRVTRELDRSRQAAGRLAVAEERLRFSRDLHDVVGRSLSAVSLTSELAGALLDRGRPEEARAELAKVRELVAGAQADMRAVVADYRRADLADEMAAAAALVRATGARWESTIDDEALRRLGTVGPRVAEAFAWVVREGTTNALRHARPARVDVTHEIAGGTAHLTLTNDGCRAAAATRSLRPGQDGGGHGLDGLRERLTPLAGTLTAQRDGDVHVLTCTVPTAAPVADTIPGASDLPEPTGRTPV